MAELRLFVAVLISDDLKRKIARVQEEFKKATSDVKWVSLENLHVTLKFLGGVSEDRLVEIYKALSSAVGGFSPFDVMVAGAGAFPSPSRPQVVWIGLGSNMEKLRQVAEKVETELQSIGFPKENRKFNAHITIGRARDARGARGLPDVIRVHEGEEFGSLRVDRVVLVKSDLRREGPIYSALREFPFPEA